MHNTSIQLQLLLSYAIHKQKLLSLRVVCELVYTVINALSKYAS